MRKITITRQEQVCPATGESFIPNRDNQVYKNRAVQIKNNNEQAKLKRKDLKQLNDSILSNNKKLETLYKHMQKNKLKSIHGEFVTLVEVDLLAYSKISNNTATGKRVYWSLNYGIEAVDKTMTYFLIHKK